MRLNLRRIKSQKGQALVEFALVLPILLVMMLGIMEFGRVFFSYLVITELAREGARYGVVGHTDAEVEGHVRALTSTIAADKLSINITPGDTVRGRGDGLTVNLDYSVDMVTPFIGAIVPDPFPLAASCTMRVE